MRQTVTGIRQLSVDFTLFEGVDHESDRECHWLAVLAKRFEQPLDRRNGCTVLVVAGLNVVVGVEQIGERPAVNLLRATLGLASRVGVFLGTRWILGQFAKAT